MPVELREFISELEAWSAANERDARSDTLRFWILKVPAIASSASSGILVLFGMEILAAALAAVGSTCMLIDSVNPGGQLRNAHLRAVHDLRALQNEIVAQWRINYLRGVEPKEIAADILVSARGEWKQIAEELRVAETAFAVTGHSPPV